MVVKLYIVHLTSYILLTSFLHRTSVLLYFFLTPVYSSTVLVEIVVVVLRESADWMQVAVVVTVRQALQDVTPMVRAIRRNAMMIKFFMIQTLLLLTIYGRTDL